VRATTKPWCSGVAVRERPSVNTCPSTPRAKRGTGIAGRTRDNLNASSTKEPPWGFVFDFKRTTGYETSLNRFPRPPMRHLIQTHWLTLTLRSLVLTLSASSMLAADPDPATVAKAWPAPDGLIVQVGAAQAASLAAWIAKGGRLVHGLALDDATRDRVRAGLHQQGVHPLASVATWHDGPRLPYADRLVNLLIIDRDELGARAPDPAEAARVVTPGGAILERRAGAWTTIRVPRPPGMGNWTHYDGGADGNSVSTDTEITGIRTWQWIDNFRRERWEKTGPHGGDEGNIRVWDRYAVWDFVELGKDYSQNSREKGTFPNVSVLVCRDAANGLPVWRREAPGGAIGRRRSLAVDQGLVLAWLSDGGPLTAIDIATGKDVHTYPGSEIKPAIIEAKAGEKPVTTLRAFKETHWVRIAGKTVLANGDGTLRAWTLDGKPLWEFRRQGQRVELPMVDLQRGCIYAMMVEDKPLYKGIDGPMQWGRWPTSEAVTAFVAIDLAKGTLRWENTELASRDTGMVDTKLKRKVLVGFGQLLIAGQHLIAINNRSIGGGHSAMIASMDIATGKTVSFDPKTMLTEIKSDGELQWMGFVFQAVYRDGTVYLMGSTDIYTYDPVQGTIKTNLRIPWNARCVRPVATPNHFLLGQTAFIGRDFAGEMVAVARSGCAQSPGLGAGQMFFGPHMCGCVTHFDGFLAMSPRPAPAPLAEDRRRVRPAAPAAAPPPASEPPVSPLAGAWPAFTISAPVTPTTVSTSGWSFAVDPQRHRVDASGPQGQRWSWVGDARIGAGVVVSNGVAVVGSHDGWVSGLDLATGATRWRYLAAPAQRLAVANGMLTSTWPVFGVADLGGGMAVASAGTHPELDGGIRVVALRASDGGLGWSKTITKTRSAIPAGGRGSTMADRSLINAPPQVVGGKIVIAGGAHLGSLTIDPAESGEEISHRISQAVRKKR
jgi:outer membrane protein assembly factor BamB